ncbi:MAG: cytochrome C biogenesis protein, partial [Sulfurovaceae bacterium]|nr:cytochrome C biogenesis protein [Sulfurovaceae bacterium]
SIITVASSSGYIYAYGLIFTFALGHSLLLLGAGISVGFAQSITSSSLITKLSNIINRGFAIMLIAFGIYFAYKAYLQF